MSHLTQPAKKIKEYLPTVKTDEETWINYFKDIFAARKNILFITREYIDETKSYIKAKNL